jgi:hypothetical protein
MKFVELVLRSGGRDDGGVNLIKTYYKHICKCHNVLLLYNCYRLKNYLKIFSTSGG